MRLRLRWMCADACAAPVTRPRRRRPPRPRQSLPSQVDRPMPASCSPPEYPSHPPGFANGAGRLCNPAIAPSKLDQGLQNWDKFTSVSWYPHKHHSKPKSKAGPYKLHPKFPKILFRPGRLRIYCSLDWPVVGCGLVLLDTDLCSKQAIYPAKSQSSCRHHSVFL